MNAKRRPRRSGASTITDQSNQEQTYARVRRYDAAHSRCVDEAMAEDRRYFEAHPEAMSYVRPARAHELCTADACCPLDAGSLIRVVLIGPGARARHLVAVAP